LVVARCSGSGRGPSLGPRRAACCGGSGFCAISASLLSRRGCSGLLGLLGALLPEREPVCRQLRQFRIGGQHAGLFLPQVKEALRQVLRGFAGAGAPTLCLRIIHGGSLHRQPATGYLFAAHKTLAYTYDNDVKYFLTDPRERSTVAEIDQTTGAQTTSAPVVKIKKYANRRLYNTATSSYVTLENLCQMVKDGQDFLVEDAKTGEDITRGVLTQIIFEEESKGGQQLLPIGFLRRLISFYGDSLQTLVPSYLEISMASFQRNQDQMRQYMAEAFGEMFPFRSIEEMGRQNMQMFQRAMTMFNPFVAGLADSDKAAAAGDKTGDNPVEVDTLKKQMEELRKQVEALARTKG
jgi:polyhydroxyalkanoate synthesis repressor PhaR